MFPLPSRVQRGAVLAAVTLSTVVPATASADAAHSTAAHRPGRGHATRAGAARHHSKRHARHHRAHHLSLAVRKHRRAAARVRLAAVIAAPTGLVGSVSGSNVNLDWKDVADTSLAYYAVRRGTQSDPTTGTWTRLAPNYTTSQATDSNRAAGTYYYYVTAVSKTGVVSARSTVVKVTVPAPAPAPSPTPAPAPAPTSSGNPAPTGTRLFNGSFKANWPTILEAASDRITNVTDPLGSANVLKFTVADSDVAPLTPTTNPRAQLETANIVNPGNEIWYGGRLLIPSNFPTMPSGGWVTLSSVYGPPYAGPSPASLSIAKGPMDSSFTLGSISPDYSTRYWGIPLGDVKGKWITWLVHEKFSASGWMEVWVNGKQVMARRNLALITSANNGGANHISNTFYRKAGMFSSATVYHADFGVWKVG